MDAPFEHRPVLLAAVLAAAAPVLAARADARICDATVGGAGHAFALLAAAGGSASLLGLDRDPEAAAAAAARLREFGARAEVVQGNYADLDELFAVRPAFAGGADLLVADLGVSSHQLDVPGRGFGFRSEGPLDMRFDPGGGPTARELLETLDAEELADVLWRYGEVTHARAVARAIHASLEGGRLNTTRDLARVVDGVAGRPRSGRIHAATLVFQALRIHTNQELAHLRRFLAASPRHVRPGGRLLVVSFHSLEDRLVKQALAFWERGPAAPNPRLPTPPFPAVFTRLVRRPVMASDNEVADNPRARSARLRAAVRTEAPAPDGVAPWSPADGVERA